MKNLEGETLTIEDISHKLNIDFEQAQVLAAAPALLETLERISNGPGALGATLGPETMLATIRDIVTQARAAIKAAKGD